MPTSRIVGPLILGGDAHALRDGHKTSHATLPTISTPVFSMAMDGIEVRLGGVSFACKPI